MLEIPAGAKLAVLAAPFMVTSNGTPKVNKTRILESIIIGVILSAGGYFIALPVLMEKVDTINRNIERLEKRVIAVEERMEARRQIRDNQFSDVKREIHEIKVEAAKRR